MLKKLLCYFGKHKWEYEKEKQGCRVKRKYCINCGFTGYHCFFWMNEPMVNGVEVLYQGYTMLKDIKTFKNKKGELYTIDLLDDKFKKKIKKYGDKKQCATNLKK